jgi:hypothetical protein
MVGWDIENYLRWGQHTQGADILMMGNQEWSSDVPSRDFLWRCRSYTTLDLDGGDLALDLDHPQPELDQQYDVVMNIGTLEHVWDVHQAYSTAARAVKTGGYYMGHSPCEGFPNHGINITTRHAVRLFFEINGFQVVDEWIQGNPGESRIHWIVAHKQEHRTEFAKPKQIWQSGQDAGFHA